MPAKATDVHPSVTEINKERWSGRLAGFRYRNRSGLFPPEQAMIDQLSAEMSGKRILDIGVGTGRTTVGLRALSHEYIGIDYSPDMIRRARERNPEAKYECMDARDLSCFADRSFDLVWFSFNGIDYVSHEDRLLMLREICRVTKDGGYFCFSSHNRDFHGLGSSGTIKGVRLTPNPLKLAYRCATHVWSLVNAWKLSRYEIETEEYALINDSELNNGLVTHYISLHRQFVQLREAGFTCVQAFGIDGREIDPAAPYRDGYMIHYHCIKDADD